MDDSETSGGRDHRTEGRPIHGPDRLQSLKHPEHGRATNAQFQNRILEADLFTTFTL